MEVELKIKYSEAEIEEILKQLGYDIEIHKLPDNTHSDFAQYQEYKLALKEASTISISNEYTKVFKRYLEDKVREFTSKIGNNYLYD